MIGPLLAVLLAASPALRVDAAADAGLPCAANAALDGSLRQRLPGVRVEEGPEAGLAGADLHASLRPEAGAWALELRRGGGEVALRRRLAFAPGACGLAADTAALVIDRFLEEIRWPGRPPSIAPLPAPPRPEPLEKAVAAPQPPPKIEPPKPDASPAAQLAPASISPIGLAAPGAGGADPSGRLTIALGPAAWVGLPRDLRAAALLEATLRLADRFEVGVTALAALPSASAVTISGESRGTLSVQSALVGAIASACADAGRFRLCGGPLAGVRASSGSPSGRLFQASSALLIQPELGLRATAALPISSRFSLALVALAAAPLGSGTFNVAGADAARELPAVDLSLGLRLGFSALP